MNNADNDHLNVEGNSTNNKGILFLMVSLLIVLTFIFNSVFLPATIVRAQTVPSAPNNPRHVYLPLLTTKSPRLLLLGTYTDGYLGQQATINNNVVAIDNWAGKRFSIVGTFIAIEDGNPGYNIPVPLGLLWDSGYTPFVNLGTSVTLQYINAGNLDSQIQAMALAFKKWRDQGLAKNQNRKAFVAPLQEMNGYWISYHGSPSDFKAAFSRIQNIFNQQGAGSAVRWVFAPNGWSDPSDPPFEQYYPGDSAVEVIGFSSYNYGYCPTNQWPSWDGPDLVFGPYLARMRTMAPSKPIIVAQTGTTAYDQSGYDTQAKNQWLIDSYNYLANYRGVVGVIYFNLAVGQSIDWAFYQLSSGLHFDGYRTGVSNSNIIYLSPEDLAVKTLYPW